MCRLSKGCATGFPIDFERSNQCVIDPGRLFHVRLLSKRRGEFCSKMLVRWNDCGPKTARTRQIAIRCAFQGVNIHNPHLRFNAGGARHGFARDRVAVSYR